MDHWERLLDTFAKKIGYVRKASMGVPKTFNIDLSVPLIDQRYDISGNLYYVWSSPAEGYYVDIKVNKNSEPALRCERQTGLITPFDKLLITTPEDQDGDMVILYGTEAPELLSIIDNRSAAGLLAELQGDLTHYNFGGVTITAAPEATLIMSANVDRKGAIITAISSNTGSVFLGFNNTVTVGGTPGTPGIWFAELQPGQSWPIDDYRGPVYGIATAAQVVGIGEV